MRTDWHNIDPDLMAVLGGMCRSIAELPQVSKMVLFGSRAKGTGNETSDVDLAVFFDDDGEHMLEKFRSLMHICANPVLDIQVQAFCAEELKNPCGIVEEIDMYGIELPLPHK